MRLGLRALRFFGTFFSLIFHLFWAFYLRRPRHYHRPAAGMRHQGLYSNRRNRSNTSRLRQYTNTLFYYLTFPWKGFYLQTSILIFTNVKSRANDGEAWTKERTRRQATRWKKSSCSPSLLAQTEAEEWMIQMSYAKSRRRHFRREGKKQQQRKLEREEQRRKAKKRRKEN